MVFDFKFNFVCSKVRVYYCFFVLFIMCVLKLGFDVFIKGFGGVFLNIRIDLLSRVLGVMFCRCL